MPHQTVSDEVNDRIRMLLRRDLKLPQDMALDDQTPLFGGEFDLDSLDALMLVSSVEKEFGVSIPNEAVGRQILHSIGTLSEYVGQRMSEDSSPGRAAPAEPVAAVDDLDALLAALPHGDAFRFLTRLTSVTPGIHAEAVWDLRGHEPLFAGHFPGRPIVPGVLISEAMAQLSGIVGASRSQVVQAVAGSISHLDVRFRRMVEPPAVIRLTSTLREVMGELFRFEASARVGDEIVAEGHVTLRLA